MKTSTRQDHGFTVLSHWSRLPVRRDAPLNRPDKATFYTPDEKGYTDHSFVDVIDPLTHPEKHGGKAEDAFDVIVVDHPGTGWSEAPALRGGHAAVRGRSASVLQEDD